MAQCKTEYESVRLEGHAREIFGLKILADTLGVGSSLKMTTKWDTES